jgi:hypothetical protein
VEVLVEDNQERHAPHTMLEVVSCDTKGKVVASGNLLVDGVASLLHDHLKVQPPSTLKLWLHPAINLLWIVVQRHICSIILHRLTIMGRQPQVVVHINEVFWSVYIYVVSLHIVDEATGAPTPLLEVLTTCESIFIANLCRNVVDEPYMFHHSIGFNLS